jgi:hypothetical protein
VKDAECSLRDHSHVIERLKTENGLEDFPLDLELLSMGLLRGHASSQQRRHVRNLFYDSRKLKIQANLVFLANKIETYTL